MNTLTSAPLAPLLAYLFELADNITPASHAGLAALSEEEHTRLMQSKTAYRELYSQLKDVPLAVSRETGRLLYMLARSSKAKNIVEFGTSFGLSTLHLAAALRDNGGGKVITSEFEPAKVALARNHFADAGVSDLIEIREGDALETLATDLPSAIDMLVLDGAKALYPDILQLAAAHLRPGALIIADDADYSPAYLARVRASGGGFLSLPFGDDVEVSVWLGQR
ncbi:O-methyltransferase [Pantoea sp. At-9b]|uniref:O-methyltransferase n=1 Tax=Pantoea sp. (strain At-9b) TaxID=592316 RepID=UPI0001B3F149|nr:O-methyltransferase [Pantoea sp. At-9b]ADU72052.1 O-methyltransferase family 3 [Pantoea sp. At-9b]